MRLRQLIALSLLIVMLVAVERPALAESTDWSITGVAAILDLASSQRLELPPEAVIDQGAEAFALQTTQAIDPASLAGNVSLLNSQGESLDWTVTTKDGLLLTKGAPLQPDQTYTIQVKGGAEGVKSTAGVPLAQNYSLSFRTQAGALQLQRAMTTPQGGSPIDLPDVIQRDTYSFTFTFDRILDCATLTDALLVTDSQGQPVTWNVACRGPVVTLVVPYFAPDSPTIALPRNASFVLRFKGGADGLKSAGGTALAREQVQIVTTEDKPLIIRYDQANPEGGAAMEAKQTEYYRLWAEAGPFQIQVNLVSEQQPIHVVLQDLQTGAYLVDEWATGWYSKSLTLPKTGHYDLILGSNYLTHLGVEGTELRLSLERPILQFPEMRPFATQKQPFTVTATLVDPAFASSLGIWLNDQRLGSLVPSQARPSLSALIDPTQLADGLYDLTGYAEGNGNENAVLQSRSFLVDQKDSYGDVGSTHWARPYIEVMSHLEILSGRGDGLFGPGCPVRRDEFAKILAATLGLKATNTTAMPFADMKNDWSKPYLQAVYEEGLMKGEVVNGKRYFYPAKTISRAEAAVTLARAIGADQINLGGYIAPVKDWSSVPTWARSSVAVLLQLKWISGFPDGTFGPSKRLNRDQSAKVLANFLGMQ